MTQNSVVHEHDFDVPRRGHIYCTHCGEEIEATGIRYHSIEISGARDYKWRHVGSQSAECVVVRHARPYDDFAAHRSLETARSGESS